MHYDLNLLPVFIAMMEERSVTRAAERLNITQPALSNALNRLRTTLRDPLFIRERHGMRPTRVAEEIAPSIKSALATLNDLVLGQQDFDPAKAVRTFVIAPNSYVEFVLMPTLVSELRKKAPGISLRFIPYGNDLVETGVVSGDTAIAIGRATEPPDNLVVQHLMDDGLACVVRANHPDIKKSISRAQYERLKHVNVLPPGRIRAGLFQALQKQGLKREVAVSVTHFLAVPEIVVVTDYCATLPIQISKKIAKDKRLKILPSPADLGTFPVEMIWHVRYRHDPAHQWLRNLIFEVVRMNLFLKE